MAGDYRRRICRRRSLSDFAGVGLRARLCVHFAVARQGRLRNDVCRNERDLADFDAMGVGRYWRLYCGAPANPMDRHACARGVLQRHRAWSDYLGRRERPRCGRDRLIDWHIGWCCGARRWGRRAHRKFRETADRVTLAVEQPASEAIPAIPTRRLSPAWAPPALVAVLVTVGLAYYRVPLLTTAIFVAYLALGIVLPGTLLWRAVVHRPAGRSGWLVEEVAASQLHLDVAD